MTARQYIDEIILRLRRYQVETAFDDLTILTYINKAREVVVLQSIDLFPELFTTSQTFDFPSAARPESLYNGLTNLNQEILSGYSVQLSPDFIRPLEVWLIWTTAEGVTEWRQCRIVNKKEFYNTLRHSFNTTQFPTFVGHFEEIITDGYSYFIFAVPQDLLQQNDIKLIVYYLYMPSKLDLYGDVAVGPVVTPAPQDSETIIPGFLQDLVIQQAMFYLLTTIDQANALQRCKDELVISLKILEFNKQIAYLQHNTLLPSKKTLNNTNIPLIQLNIGGQNG